MNGSNTIPHDIKQAEPEHYFGYTNWRLKICIWRLIIISPVSRQKATKQFFLISSPATSCFKKIVFLKYSVYKMLAKRSFSL